MIKHSQKPLYHVNIMKHFNICMPEIGARLASEATASKEIEATRIVDEFNSDEFNSKNQMSIRLMEPEGQTLINAELWIGDERAAICRGALNTLEIIPETEMAGLMITVAIALMSISRNTSLIKEWRCTGRKRFIKLLMSYGNDRNTASKVAAAIPMMHGRKSYQNLLFEFVIHCTFNQIFKKG